MPLFAIPFPAIDPVAIEIGPFAVRWYALAYIAGILTGWWYALKLVRNDALWGGKPGPLSQKDIDDFLLFGTVGLIAGGRLGYVFFYQPEFYLSNPAEIISSSGRNASRRWTACCGPGAMRAFSPIRRPATPTRPTSRSS